MAGLHAIGTRSIRFFFFFTPKLDKEEYFQLQQKFIILEVYI